MNRFFIKKSYEYDKDPLFRLFAKAQSQVFFEKCNTVITFETIYSRYLNGATIISLFKKDFKEVTGKNYTYQLLDETLRITGRLIEEEKWYQNARSS